MEPLSSSETPPFGLRPLSQSSHLKTGQLARQAVQNSNTASNGLGLAAVRGSSLPNQFERMARVSNSNSQELGTSSSLGEAPTADSGAHTPFAGWRPGLLPGTCAQDATHDPRIVRRPLPGNRASVGTHS